MRKSHNLGKTHIKLVIDYYEAAAREAKLLPPTGTVINELDQSKELEHYSEAGAPGTEGVPKDVLFDQLMSDRTMPPPVHLASMPPPPNQFYVVQQQQQIDQQNNFGK